MKNLIFAAFAALSLGANAAVAKPFAEMFPDTRKGIGPEDRAALEKLDYRQGRVQIGSGFAEIEVGEDFYFLNEADARTVLEELWGNPPADTLGMIFPVQYTPLDRGSWGVEVYFEPLGYVSDDDAASYNYDDLLKEMQGDILAGNDWRKENGYMTQELVGWAAAPRYDAEAHKLYWAQEFRFEGIPGNTLNYYIRVLGRKGVLSLNFIADMTSLSEVEAQVPTVLDMVSFTEGNRYSEFDAATDKVAEASFSQLIGGGGFAQVGLVAVALVLLKKFWFILLLPLIFLKNLFTGRRSS